VRVYSTSIDNHQRIRGGAAARLKTQVEQRDFDMLSNQQFRDHETWSKQQDQEAKQQIEEKYWYIVNLSYTASIAEV
jgi:hypothetical protein